MDIQAGLNAARAYQAKGNNPAARETLRKILSFNNRSDEAWLLFSEVAESEKDALYCLRQAVKINPVNTEAVNRIQEILDRQAQQAPQIDPSIGMSPPAQGKTPNRFAAFAAFLGIIGLVGVIILITILRGIAPEPITYSYSTPAGTPIPIPTATPYPYGNWKIDSYVDEFSDKEYGNLFLKADDMVTGWLGKTTRPELHIECNGNNLYLNIWVGMFPELNTSDSRFTLVKFRFDKDESFTEHFSYSNDGEWLHLGNYPRAVELVRIMSRKSTLLMGFTPLNSSAVSTTFSLGGLTSVWYLFGDWCSVPL